jgi:hypothetical protein
MEEKYIEFNHWKTGEKIKYTLSFSHPSEKETNLICPLDNTPLIFAYDDMSKVHFCPNCETNYGMKYYTQKSVNEDFQKYLNHVKEEIAKLDEKRKDLSFFLQKAEESMNKNKVNLSAEKPQAVIFDKPQANNLLNIIEKAVKSIKIP